MSRRASAMLAVLLAVGLGACADWASVPLSAGTGPNPALPPPAQRWFPTVNIAPAVGWMPGAVPQPAPGLRVNAFARDLDHPRWLLVLPNGDVLVAESNAPARTDRSAGIRQWLSGLMMKIAGAGVPSANRITLLRDTDHDGVADLRTVLLEGLNSPFGMALVEDQLYVANTDAVLRFPYVTGQTRIELPGVKLADLPAGPINHHWTKNLIVDPAGDQLYVTVGSNSNVAERGMALEEPARRDLGDRSAQRQAPDLRQRSAQSERAGVGTSDPHLVDRGQRARRAGQRSRSGLPDVRARRRLLRLAPYLFRLACRCPRDVSAARQGTSQEQEGREEHQVHGALHHVRAAGAQRDRADQEGQRQQHQVLGSRPSTSGRSSTPAAPPRRDRQPDAGQGRAQGQVHAGLQPVGAAARTAAQVSGSSTSMAMAMPTTALGACSRGHRRLDRGDSCLARPTTPTSATSSSPRLARPGRGVGGGGMHVRRPRVPGGRK
jgi:hypothetical protein